MDVRSQIALEHQIVSHEDFVTGQQEKLRHVQTVSRVGLDQIATSVVCTVILKKNFVCVILVILAMDARVSVPIMESVSMENANVTVTMVMRT